MDATAQSRATAVASAPMSRISILDLLAEIPMSFRALSSTLSQAALMWRISHSRSILDHSSEKNEVIEMIHVRRPATSLRAVSRHGRGPQVPVPHTIDGSDSDRGASRRFPVSRCLLSRWPAERIPGAR
jgi:hypothetical protein